MFGIRWVMPENVVSVLFSWRNWLGKFGLDIWNMVPACLIWCGLCGRRRIVVLLKESSLDQLKVLFAHTFFDWSRIWGFTQCSSILESQVSLRFSFWAFCTSFPSAFIIVNIRSYLVLNKNSLLTYPKNLGKPTIIQKRHIWSYSVLIVTIDLNIASVRKW